MAKQGKVVLTGRQIAFYVLQNHHGQKRSQQSKRRAREQQLAAVRSKLGRGCCAMDEEIGDGMLAASSYNTLEQIPSLMPEALEMHASQIHLEKQPKSHNT